MFIINDLAIEKHFFTSEYKLLFILVVFESLFKQKKIFYKKVRLFVSIDKIFNNLKTF